METRTLFILVSLLFFVGLSFSFSPMPTDSFLRQACESTGGVIQESYFTPDCGFGCSAQPETISDCKCQDGSIYMDLKRLSDFKGCDGSVPKCFEDDDCMRTNQGNVCMVGVCGFAQEPDVDFKGGLCTPAFLLSLLGAAFILK